MRLSQLAPLPLRQAVWRAVEFSLVPPAAGIRRPVAGPIVVAGMFTTANGLGESARLVHRALGEGGLEPLAFDTSPILGQGDIAWDGPLVPALPDTREGLLIIVNNAPELGRILLYAGRRQRRDWCIASLWAWETPQRPPGWIERAVMVDELWFPSRFVRDAIGPPDDTPGLVAYHPVPRREPRPAPATPLVEPGPLVFTCYADALSSLERKNPMGAIQAFRQAFGDSMDARLVVKTRNATPAIRGKLAQLIAGAPNILHVDRALDPEELAGLRARTDVLVSLHRSEGFGLTIAEAMRSGTPVIATDFSAPAEYLDESVAYPVPAREVAVDDAYGVYREGSHTWAFPDVSAAAAAMLSITHAPGEARRRAANATVRAEELFSAQAYLASLGFAPR